MQFLADENFDNRIIRGLLRRDNTLDIVRVQDVGLYGKDDPTVLAWAADANRILLSHDQRTIPAYAFARLAENHEVAGVIIVPDDMPLGLAIDEILLIVDCCSAQEWINQVQRLPI